MGRGQDDVVQVHCGGACGQVESEDVRRLLGVQFHGDGLPRGFARCPVRHGEHLGAARCSQEGDATFAGLRGADTEGELGRADAEAGTDANEGVRTLGFKMQRSLDKRSLAGAVFPAAGEVVGRQGLLWGGRLGADLPEVGIH